MNCFDSCGRGGRRRTDEFFFARSASEMRRGLGGMERALDDLTDGFRDMQIGRCIESAERNIRRGRFGRGDCCHSSCCSSGSAFDPF